MNIEVYTIDSCPWCQECIKLLKEKNIEFIEHRSSSEGIFDTFKILSDKTGVNINYVPIVFVDNNLIGAYNALKKFLEDRETIT